MKRDSGSKQRTPKKVTHMPDRQGAVLSTAAAQALADEFRSSFQGEVIDRGHPGYDEARAVWNGLIDRRPALIAQCSGTADVVEAVRVARKHRPLVSIRGGGHQVAGSGVCDDGLVIDLSRMKGVHVDPTARTARAQAGVTWGELDRETQLHALATPGGEISATGIAGLTLGGGFGFVMRTFGLSRDSVRSLEIVTADGAVRTVSREEEPELFWAARGGAGGSESSRPSSSASTRSGPRWPVCWFSIPTSVPRKCCGPGGTRRTPRRKRSRRNSCSGASPRTPRSRRNCTDRTA
ncbi:FAD-binding oxidoreductase [Streptomyces hirsutus]|uniref:FAD-binding oxidoreductase n=1 Tax=Streptomyces hirsutus TaxID=35620 RepID=UPI000B1CAB52|nr:FAD-dependent oxidoreductase [Streptomyces hirsutus]